MPEGFLHIKYKHEVKFKLNSETDLIFFFLTVQKAILTAGCLLSEGLIYFLKVTESSFLMIVRIEVIVCYLNCFVSNQNLTKVNLKINCA